MKEYIISLLDSFLSNNPITDINYDIAFYQDIANKIKYNNDYFNEYLLDLDEEKIKFIISDLADEEKNKLLASSMYLKNLLEINKKENIKIPLSGEQNSVLKRIIELLNTKISTYEEINSNNLAVKEPVENATEIKNKLLSEKLLNKNDYYLIEKIIYQNVENPDDIFNQVVTFLNAYNFNILRKNIQKPIVEEKPDIHPIIEDNNEKTQVLEAESLATNNIEPKVEIEPIIKQNEEIKIVENPVDIDIFSAQEIKYEENDSNLETKPTVKITSKTTVTELLEDLGIQEEDLSIYCKTLLSNIKDNTFKNNYKYIVNNLFNYLSQDNHSGVISLLCLSDIDTLKQDISYLKELDLNDESIKDLMNRATQLFFSNNKDNFRKNFELAISLGVKIDDLIKSNITFFYNSFEYNQNKVNLLEEKNINVNKIFETKPILFAIGLDKIIKNIDALNNYDIKIEEKDYDNITILANSNLINILDYFIEAGFSEYITLGESLKNIRSLIIKRLYYSYKNDLDIWKENIDKSRINDEYEKYIKKERKPLTEEDINYLIADYDDLEILESGKRLILFTDTLAAQIKRKYEFMFNKLIISRLKTYSIIKVLINHKVDLREAMFYALTYNSNLTNEEYQLIKKDIMG